MVHQHLFNRLGYLPTRKVLLFFIYYVDKDGEQHTDCLERQLIIGHSAAWRSISGDIFLHDPVALGGGLELEKLSVTNTEKTKAHCTAEAMLEKLTTAHWIVGHLRVRMMIKPREK